MLHLINLLKENEKENENDNDNDNDNLEPGAPPKKRARLE